MIYVDKGASFSLRPKIQGDPLLSLSINLSKVTKTLQNFKGCALVYGNCY